MNQISALASAATAHPPLGLNEQLPRVAVICSSWHAEIVDHCKAALLAEFERNSFPASQVDVFQVPGAFEIPLQAQKLARTARYQAIVACGLVVNGGSIVTSSSLRP